MAEPVAGFSLRTPRTLCFRLLFCALVVGLPAIGAPISGDAHDVADAARPLTPEPLEWIHEWAGRPVPVFAEKRLRGKELEQKSRRLARLPNLLCFQSAVFDPVLQEEPDFNEFLPRRVRRGSISDSTYRVVQFQDKISPVQRAELEATGAEVIQYVPNNAFIVRVDSEASTRIDGLTAVRWQGPVVPGYKVETRLMRQAAGLEVAEGNEATVQLVAALFPGENAAALVAEIQLMGLRVVESLDDPRNALVVIEVPRGQLWQSLRELSAAEAIAWLETKSRFVPDNDDSIWVGQSYDTANGPAEAGSREYVVSGTIWKRDILGTGQIIAVSDTGVDRDSCQVRDPLHCPIPSQAVTAPEPLSVVSQRKIVAYNVLPGATLGDEWGHGTHVVGTIAGDALAHSSTVTSAGHNTGDGIAPQAKIIMEDVGTYASEYLVGIPNQLGHLWAQERAAGAAIASNSWGARCDSPPCGRYTYDSAQSDRFVWENPEFLIFYSSGNSAESPADGTTGHADKNIITVGATTNGAAADRANGLADFSSRGPTEDGRYKPEITAPGLSVISARATTDPPNCQSGTCGTSSFSGTSMACPTGAGFAALVRQYYMDGWYPTGSITPLNAFIPSAALVKATLINGAMNMTGVGVGGDAPNHDQGWGRVHLDNALYFDDEYGTDARKIRVWDVPLSRGLMTGEVDEYQIRVNAGQALKVTLVWTDPPAAPYGGLALVNNLDLEIVGPQGHYRGNTFIDPTPTTAQNDKQSMINPIEKDDINNVEGALLLDPAAGTYTLRVKGFSIPGAADPDSIRQSYALVATGAIDLTAGSVSFAQRTYPCGSSSVTVQLFDATPSPSSVTLTCGSTGDTEVLTLSGLQPLFTATMPLDYNTQVMLGDGRLQVSDGSTVTATYVDEFMSSATATVGSCAADLVFEEARFSAGCDADRFLDADETADLSVTLRNRELSGLSNLTGTLTTLTPGVVIGTETVDFGAVSPGGRVTNPAPFVVSALSVAAGTPAEFELSLTADGFAQPVAIEFSTLLEQDLLQLTDQSYLFDFEGGLEADLSPPCEGGPDEHWATRWPSETEFSAILSTCDVAAPSPPHVLAFSGSGYESCGSAPAGCQNYPDEKRARAWSPRIMTTPPGSSFIAARPTALSYSVRASLPDGPADDEFYAAVFDADWNYLWLDESMMRRDSSLNTNTWQTVQIDLTSQDLRLFEDSSQLGVYFWFSSGEYEDENPSSGTGKILVDNVRLTYESEGRIPDGSACTLPCSSPGVPSGPTAISGPDMIHLGWEFAGDAGEYHVYRGTDGCDGSFTQVAELPGTYVTYNDPSVTSGTTYFYRIRSADPTGACESADSDCVTVVADAGACRTSPDFSGVDRVASLGDAVCAVSVEFDPGSSNCGGSVAYDIFRSWFAGFTPSPGNLVAEGVAGGPWVDSQVSGFSRYCYAVRAVDPVGNDDGNTKTVCAIASGPKFAGAFRDDAEIPGLLELEQPWSRSANRNHSAGGEKSYKTGSNTTYPASACGAATSPELELLADGTTTLSFWTSYNVEYGDDGMVVEVATEQGGFNDWIPISEPGFYPGDFFNTDWCEVGDSCVDQSYCNACCYPSDQGAFNGPDGNVSLTAWAQSTADLSAYNGETIKFRFNFSSDFNTSYEGIYLDEIELNNVARPSFCTGDSCTTGPEFYGLVSAVDLDPGADTGVLLSWSSPGNWGDGDEGAMLVHRDGALIATLSALATSHVDETGRDGAEHLYHVAAENSCGLRDGNSITRIARDCAVSDADVDLAELGVDVVNGKVHLSWSAIPGATLSELYWVAGSALTNFCGSGSVWAGELVDLDAPAFSFEHDVYSDGNSYFYRVGASSGVECPRRRGTVCP